MTEQQALPRPTKACTYCKVEKALTDYGKNKACRDGRRSRCRRCEADCAAMLRKEQPHRARSAWQRYSEAHPQRIREKNRRWRAANREMLAKKDGARAKAWASENPGRARANRANHHAAKLRATPSWANREEVAAIYKAAHALGPGFHVDHIIPLQGETVCGLHCEANLQIIPSSVNIAKRNRHWPHMFEVSVK